MVSYWQRGLIHAGRFSKIIAILVKYGFDDVISQMELHIHFPAAKKLISTKKLEEITHYTSWQRLRMVMEELGPAFVKLGQILSNRPDIMPSDLVEELEKLQDNAASFSYNEVEKLIKNELGNQVSDVFSEFDKKPFAAASMAQVHLGKLDTGKEVAVKLLRPGISEVIKKDIDIMYSLAWLLEHTFDEMKNYNIISVVELFEKSIKRELDLVNEAANIKRFKSIFKNESHLLIPEIYEDYSSSGILTMEHIDGIKVSDIIKLKERGIDLKETAEKGIELFFKQVFIQGYFHADPHPGNIFVTKNGKICFLDFGMMGNLSENSRNELCNIFIGIEMHDTKRIVRSILKLSTQTRIEDTILFENKLSGIIDQYGYRSLDNIKLQEVITDLRKIISEFQIKIPVDFFLLFKALVTIESIGHRLYPQLNLLEHLKPYVEKLIKQRLNPALLIKKAYLSMMDIGGFINDLPLDFKEIVDKIKKGKVKVDLEHTGIEPLIREMDIVSNRISISIIIASLILGSSIIILAEIPPTYYEIPVLGLAGYLFSGLLGIWLIISIIRKRKL